MPCGCTPVGQSFAAPRPTAATIPRTPAALVSAFSMRSTALAVERLHTMAGIPMSSVAWTTLMGTKCASSVATWRAERWQLERSTLFGEMVYPMAIARRTKDSPMETDASTASSPSCASKRCVTSSTCVPITPIPFHRRLDR